MQITIVTACPGGRTTAWLAAERLARAAARRGWQTVSPENDAGASDLVIVAASAPTDLSDYAGRALYRADMADALASPDAVLDIARDWAEPYVPGADASATQPAGPASSDQAPAEADRAGASIVAVAACSSGKAQTFMAAESLASEALSMGHDILVESQGVRGAQDELTEREIAVADVVLLACDTDIDESRFVGKRVYRTSTDEALRQPRAAIEAALDKAVVKPVDRAGDRRRQSSAGDYEGNVYQHLLTGVSYMLPMAVIGGLCIALSFVFGVLGVDEQSAFAQAFTQIGTESAFRLMVPLLAGYIAYSIAGRAGLTPGLLGGWLASELSAGYIGGGIAGFLGGYIALGLMRAVPLPASVRSLKPILIVPLLSSLATGLILIFVIGAPIAEALEWLADGFNALGSNNAALLGLLLGAMMCVDMGGPINKTAYIFGVGLLSSNAYLPMAAIMAGGMAPAVGLGLASQLARARFAASERQDGRSALALGLCFITEGAIPFAKRDPLRVIPCAVAGGAVAGGLSMFFGCKLMAPHGGLFVMLIPNAVTHALLYPATILAGSVVTGLGYTLLKPRPVDPGRKPRGRASRPKNQRRSSPTRRAPAT